MLLQELFDVKQLLDSHKGEILSNIYRIGDNALILRISGVNYCMDLHRNNPSVYIIKEAMKSREYNAPFDSVLTKYFCKAKLLSCDIDGMNKILMLTCILQNAYKSLKATLYLEFINRYSNAIIVLDDTIISALRFVKTNRIIIPKSPFTRMPQPGFSKILESRDIDIIKIELQNRYKDLQNSLLENKRKVILRSLNLKLERLESIRSKLPDIKTLEKEKSQCNMLANYILLHMDTIPHYASSICIDGIEYKIPIESKISLACDKLFTAGKKIKQKIQHINIQKENLDNKISFLHRLIAFAQKADLDQLSIIGQKRNTIKKEVKKHYETFYIDGIKVSIGRSEGENIRLLQEAKAEFLWLHILHIPSSHLIIHASKVSNLILEHAGVLLAKLCGINDSKVVIDYTKRRFVRITSGAKVVYSKESKLYINL